MKIKVKFLSALIAFSCLPSAAQACFFNKPIVLRIAQGPYTSVLLAQITASEYAKKKNRKIKTQPWIASARSLQDLSAHASNPSEAKRFLYAENETYTIRRSGDSAACDDGIAAPKIGDIWVMYMQDNRVVRAYPFAVAYNNDPHLRLTRAVSNED